VVYLVLTAYNNLKESQFVGNDPLTYKKTYDCQQPLRARWLFLGAASPAFVAGEFEGCPELVARSRSQALGTWCYLVGRLQRFLTCYLSAGKPNIITAPQ